LALLAVRHQGFKAPNAFRSGIDDLPPTARIFSSAVFQLP